MCLGSGETHLTKVQWCMGSQLITVVLADRRRPVGGASTSTALPVTVGVEQTFKTTKKHRSG